MNKASKMINFLSRSPYKWLVMTILCTFHILKGIIPGCNFTQSDFPNYYYSAALVMQNKLAVAYNDAAFADYVKKNQPQATVRFSLYPPANAFIMLPLTYFNLIAAKRIWLALSIMFAIGICVYIVRLAQCSKFTACVLLLVGGFNLTNDFYLGQVYCFATFLTIAAIYHFTTQHCKGAMYASIALALKWVMVPAFMLVLIKKYRKHTFHIFIWSVLIGLATILLVGVSVCKFYLINRMIPHAMGEIFNSKPFAVQYQSMISLLSNLFLYDAQINPLPLVVESPQMFVITKTMFYAIILICGFVVFSKYKNHHQGGGIITSFGILSLLVLEAGSATYHLILLLPIAAYMHHLSRPNQLYQVVNVGFVALLGFAPTLLNSILITESTFILLRYHRMVFLLLYFGLTFLCLIIQHE